MVGGFWILVEENDEDDHETEKALYLLVKIVYVEENTVEDLARKANVVVEKIDKVAIAQVKDDVEKHSTIVNDHNAANVVVNQHVSTNTN